MGKAQVLRMTIIQLVLMMVLTGPTTAFPSLPYPVEGRPDQTASLGKENKGPETIWHLEIVDGGEVAWSASLAIASVDHYRARREWTSDNFLDLPADCAAWLLSINRSCQVLLRNYVTAYPFSG
ncbi:MAG: hypothetical protein QXU79_00620 [Candidatus Micrarchaeaceae archaeon]